MVDEVTASPVRASTSLRAEARLGQLVESLDIGMLFWHVEAGVTDANDAFLDLVRYTREDLERGLVPWGALTPPEWRSADSRALRELSERGVCTPFEKEYLRKDQTRVPVLLASAVFAGETRSIVSFAHDVSDARDTRAALLEASRNTALVARVATLHAQGNAPDDVLAASAQAIVEQLGVTSARIWMLDEAAQVLVLRATGGEPAAEHEPRARVPVGQYRVGIIARDRKSSWTDPAPGGPGQACAGFPLLVRDELVGVMEVLADRALSTATLGTLATISDTIAVGIKHHAVEVERVRIAEQLRQAQKMEALGRLAGGIAHDFNKILSTIGGHTRLALDRLAAGDPLAKDLCEVEQASERAMTLTQQLLAFSKKQPIHPVPLNLNDVVDSMKVVLKGLLGERVQWVSRLNTGLGTILADQAQMEQVLFHLATYAREAMPRGGRFVVATGTSVVGPLYSGTHPRVVPGRYVVLSVSDTGVGTSEEELAHLFEPFFSTREDGRGAGLGLATVYGIVKQNKGQILVESHLGRGTTFRLYFPQVVGSAATTQVRSSARRTASVLVVEDQEGVRSLVRSVLRGAGYTVLESSNGADALVLCERRAEPVDLLLTDLVMPNMGGLELLRRLLARWPALRALLMSGVPRSFAEPSDSAFPFLQKPFSPNQLLVKVEEALVREPAGADPHRNGSS